MSVRDLRHTRAHPDAQLLARTRRALDWWADRPPSTPTSSITGGGTIAAVEEITSRLLGRPTLALPAATFGLRVALLAVGVGSDDDVLVSALDWPAAAAAVRSLGAWPVPVPIDATTLTMDPEAAGRARTRRTRAAIVTHLHGICADVPALRSILGDLPVIEDAAQAFGTMLDGRPAGSLGDIGVLSFGPGKTIDAGELAVLVARDETLLAEAVRRSQHPVRQRLSGTPAPRLGDLTGRAAPLSALLAAHELDGWPARAAQSRRLDGEIHRLVDDHLPGVVRLAAGTRRSGVPGTTVLLLPGSEPSNWWPDGASWTRNLTVARSGALPADGLAEAARRRTADLGRRVRLVDAQLPATSPDPDHAAGPEIQSRCSGPARKG